MENSIKISTEFEKTNTLLIKIFHYVYVFLIFSIFYRKNAIYKTALFHFQESLKMLYSLSSEHHIPAAVEE